MKTLKANVMTSNVQAEKLEAPVKQWNSMAWGERWTYTWHVVVMVCTLGFVFPNAIIS